MPIEVLMPALSPTMKEGNLTKWLKKEGDRVKSGDVIAEIETDKATMEVESVDEGVLGKILVAEGTENVAVNSLIALILDEGEDQSVLSSYEAKGIFTHAVSKGKDLDKLDKSGSVDIFHVDRSTKNDAEVMILASPLAKRLAKDNNINLSGIQGSGPKGRVIKDDIIRLLGSAKANKALVFVRDSQEYVFVKNSNIRKIIAKRLLESKQTVPHFYLSVDLNIDKLLELRKAINDASGVNSKGDADYKVSVNDLVIKAVGIALAKVPKANSSWTDDGILLYNNVDISVAVAVDGGLLTPIVRNADKKSVVAISKEVKYLAQKARDGKLQPDEFQGGGFSVSNLGMYGVDSFSAIINPPQSCILAVGAGIEKPVVIDGKVKIASVMNVTLSCDHRSVDGAVGAEFLKVLRGIIENPISMVICH